MSDTSKVRDRSLAFWLGLVAAISIIVLYAGNVVGSLGFDELATSWSDLLATDIAGLTLAGVITIIFWLSFVALVVLLVFADPGPVSADLEIGAPRLVHRLFYTTRGGLVWLPVRLFLGFTWLASGLGKLGEESWRDGTALAGFWSNVVTVPESGQAAITYDWYRDLIEFMLENGWASWFTWVVMLGEIAAGLGLLVGLLTAIAAFGGALMNFSFMLAGSAGINPVLFAMAVVIMLAWRVAGWYGLDRFIMRRYAVRPSGESSATPGSP
jgi:thiosulfate dehydrogenase [quinone] large subunit